MGALKAKRHVLLPENRVRLTPMAMTIRVLKQRVVTTIDSHDRMDEKALHFRYVFEAGGFLQRCMKPWSTKLHTFHFYVLTANDIS